MTTLARRAHSNRWTTASMVFVLLVAAAICGCGAGGGSTYQQPFLSPPSESPPPAGAPEPVRISSIWPTGASAGASDLQVIITGVGFDNEGVIRSRVIWAVNGGSIVLPMTFDSSTQITATIPAVLMSSPVTADVFIQGYDTIEGTYLGGSPRVKFVVSPPLTSGFAPTASMNVARGHHTATLLTDGKVLIVGGDASAELFDPADESFVPTGNMTTSRYGASAVRLKNGKVLIAGGMKPDSGTWPLTQLESVELYDPQTGAFIATGSMHAAHIDATATLLADGRVLIAGGTGGGSSKGKAVGSADAFDPGTSTFTSVGQMNSDRAEHAAVLLDTGDVLIVGGRNGWAPDAADDPPWDPLFVELFDPATGSFTVAGNMSTTRLHPIAIPLPGGKALVLGGFTEDLQNIHEQPINPQYAEVYNRRSRAFTSLNSPRIPLGNYTGTMLNTGMVLIVGGQLGGRAVDTVELLDPATGSLISAGRLTTARSGHSATLLNDGRVLVTGGYDGDGNALATAELWSKK